ncbi:MAG: glycosidase [Croceibacterium sp.]
MESVTFAVDRLIVTPDDIDLSRSPLAGQLGAETYVLGAFNPGLTRLASGNLLLMVRVAEALRAPVFDGHVHAIRWDEGRYVLDAWPLEHADTADPRTFTLHGYGWKVMALTSLSWLLPVELTPDGGTVVALHYDRAIAPQGSWQCYGIEDPRISRVGARWLMTTCSVSPERHSTTLYTSDNALDWTFEGIVLDHQNKDMLIFEGLVGGRYWAQTRPLGQLFFTYPPGSPYHAGPSINLATSPDALHWKPHLEPGIRPHAGTPSTARIGGGAPPILTEIAGQRGWLTLWHGVEPYQIVGKYRTYWSLLDPDQPWKVLATSHPPLLEANPDLTEPLRAQMYLDHVVFTTGIADAGDHFIVASGEADLACRITHVAKSAFVPSEDGGAQ